MQYWAFQWRDAFCFPQNIGTEFLYNLFFNSIIPDHWWMISIFVGNNKIVEQSIPCNCSFSLPPVCMASIASLTIEMISIRKRYSTESCTWLTTLTLIPRKVLKFIGYERNKWMKLSLRLFTSYVMSKESLFL